MDSENNSTKPSPSRGGGKGEGDFSATFREIDAIFEKKGYDKFHFFWPEGKMKAVREHYRFQFYLPGIIASQFVFMDDGKFLRSRR